MDEEDAPRVKRFKHQSYAKSLKEVHLPSALSQTPLDNDLEDHESHFYTSLEHWKQLNLSPGFIKFSQRAGPLSASMPLLLHNWQDIMQLWVYILLQKITHDLRMTLSPVYLDPVLPRLLALLLRSKIISAPALTALLATFAALFKFLLIPASSTTELQLLEKTWICIRDILPRCLPEVQRAMSEVWGGRAVILLAESVIEQTESEVQDAAAWCVVYACKSVSQTLHTCTPSIVLPLLNHHLASPALLSSEPTPRTYTLLRRLLTALIHHVRNAEHFAAVGDVLVDRFILLTQETSPDDLEDHATALLVAFPPVLKLYLSSPSPHIRAALLHSAFWMGKGREDSDAAVLFAISLTGAVAELGWAGWRAIGIPDGSEELQRKTVGLIADLWRMKKLGSNDGDVVTWGVRKLRTMAGSSSGVAPVLIELCEAHLASADAPSSGPSHSWFVGTCMCALSRRPAAEWENLELARWVRTCTTVALAALMTTRGATEVSIEEIYPALAPIVLSHSRALRLGALRLLAATQPSDAREVVKRCLAGEEVPLDVQGVRERVLRIGRVETVVKDKQKETDVGPDLCGRWLVAQLKVNLRPLWSPAAGALAQMAQRFGDEIWRLVFQDDNMESGQLDEEETGDEGKDPWEEERTWRDPSAHKLRGVVGKWLTVQHDVKELVKSQTRGDRLDLLFAMGECPALVQKHNRDIVPLFLDLAMPSPDSSSKLPRHKLTAWLTLFSKLGNPKGLRSPEALRTIYISNLSHPDRAAAILKVEPQDRQEVVDVITRLLFGLMLEKKGRSRGADRRAAVLGIACGTSRQQQPFLIQDVPSHVSEKQQIGFIGLLALLGATMDFIARAQIRITSPGRAEEEEEIDVEDEGDEDVDEPSSTSSASKILRSIRQLGLKRFADFLRCPVQFDYTPYMQAAFSAFISPRLASLDRENTQAPSALLELFYVWTLDGERVMFLTQYDDQVLPKVYGCLVATNVKPAVVSKIFDIVEKLLAFSTVDLNVSEKVVKPHVSLLLNNLATLVERTKGTAAVSSPLGQRQISILSEIAQLFPEKVKVDLLNIIGTLMPLIPDLSTYELISQLFQSLRSRAARISLVGTLQRLSLLDTSLERLAQTLDSLNAYSSRRMDEPDFDRRLAAFATLNESLFKALSSTEWLPIIYSMLHFIQDPAELAIRNNAAYTMRDSPELEVMFTRNGLRSKNELVRSELLGCEAINSLQEMRVLLAGGDEEANFFNNVHHIQIHRRSRALRRLADQCDEGHLRSNTLAEIFVPLVSNYITATASVDHHLVNDAILTTGRMAKHLAWGAYYALVQKYLRLSRAKDASERVYVRTLVSLLDNFHFPMEAPIPIVEEAPGPEGEEDDIDGADEDAPVPALPTIPTPLNSTTRIADAVNLRLLPNLLNHLEKRDATTEDTTRIPIAIGIVKVAKHLPATTREPQISRLLTVLSQETRDLTRDTLSRIAVSLGPSYLPLMLREMRAALLRGPQLHVLAHVTHALLHSETFGNLDDCVNDVIFGESAKDVMAEEFKTKMREVRSSSAKGLDSFGIIAKYITPPRISSLLTTESVKVMQLLLAVLNANKHLIPTELLVLCHTLISQNAKFLKQTPMKQKGRAKGDAIVQIKRQIAEIIKRLESMVVVIGNTLYSSSSPVLVPWGKSLPVFVQQTIGIVKQAGNTESEVVQVAFKSLAIMLRDGPAELLTPDLEEPSRQASVFAMLRAIVARKFVVPEIYDVMDKVADIMVTSQSPQVQELCRSVLLQFLLDYPQGKGRLRNQMNFLAKNLSYEYESGRKSVLELLGAVLAKFEAGLVREYVDLLFVALVMVIANDDSTKCREMAAQLIKTLFSRLDDERRRVILSHLHSWASQYAQPQLARVSAQVYGLVIDIMGVEALVYIPGIVEDIDASLERSCQELAAVETTEEDSMDVDIEWQLPYHSLLVLSKVLRVFPSFVTDSEKVKWDAVVAHLLFPHAWVRTASCRLLGTLFTAVPPAPPQDLESSPVSGPKMQEVATKLCTQLKSEHLDEALSLQVVKNLFYIGKCFLRGPLFALSYQIRSAHIARRNRSFSAPNWYQQPLAALRWFAAMAAHMEADRLEKFLVHDDTIRDAQMEELKTVCIELQDLIQSKVGTTKFSTAYNQIRQGVLGVQRARKTTRAVAAAARRKMQRNSIKKESKKRKSSTFADGKGRIKRRREE
ncbi:armadillo-type protein [Mycena alexandri]|uniref:Armadillo-type protein n=1 Tax=Mycena alexandri TaxID=1745969 RepID=A0AAD6SXT9_9AGAR|nr:armadillo-type protein [Mycena alexandri]